MNGKVALVTGASDGIGLAMAKEFVKRGAQVTLVARRKEILDGLCRELGPNTLAIQADVTVDGAMERAVEETLARFGHLDYVIANAGMGVIGRVDELTMDDWRRQFDLNFFGVLRTFYASIVALKKSRGSFAVVGSAASYHPVPGGSAYSASKAAIRNLCNSLNVELGADGVSVTHLAPGFIVTEIRQKDNFGVLKAGSKDPIPPWLPMAVDVAAQQMVDAVVDRKSEVTITMHAKILRLVTGLFPGVIKLGYAKARQKPQRLAPDVSK